MITKVAQIDTPAQWVRLKREYDLSQAQRVETKTTKQHARWLRLRTILRCRWQVFTLEERNQCIALYGEHINPPGA